MRTPKTRHLLHLPDALSARLNELAQAPGVSKSSILAEAVEAWLDRRGKSELDDRFGLRLDRMSAALGRLERNDEYVLEILAAYVRFFLTLNAPAPVEDQAARAQGRARFEAFTDLVAARVREGKLSFPVTPPHQDGGAS